MHGYSDWFKELKEKRKNEGNQFAANVSNDPFESVTPPANFMMNEQEMIGLIKHEIAITIKGKGKETEESQAVNFISESDVAGIFLNSIHTSSASFKFNSWIIDTGAISYLCTNKMFFDMLHDLQTPLKLHLPDGSIKTISQSGDITLPNNILLSNTLYTSHLNHNLLSVSRLMKDNDIVSMFRPNKCFLQERHSSKLLAVGKVKRNLYFLDDTSFV